MSDLVSPTIPPWGEGLLPEPCVVTIGTFDGVHLGHQHLLRRAVGRARQRGINSLAVTFEPPPALVLRPDHFVGRLCTALEKVGYLRKSGVDKIVTIPFDLDFAQQSPLAFLTDLRTATHLEELWVGEAFALGRNRVGDVAMITSIGHDLGFATTVVPRLAVADQIVSSSGIRQAVIAGDVTAVQRGLGRPFRVTGEVIHGAHLGRTIGFPTANILPPAELAPLPDGIYASLATLPRQPSRAAHHPSMTYIGTRPTVDNGPRVIETHLFDFDGDLYGETLAVDVVARLRADQRFASLDQLIVQLKRDEANARAALAAVSDRRTAPSPD